MTSTSLELAPLELAKVHAVEILDSRGNPTLAVTMSPWRRHGGSGGCAVGRLHRIA